MRGPPAPPPPQVGVLAQGVLDAPLQALDGAAAPGGAARAALARHLAALRHCDFSAALDHLHRYFDRLGPNGQPHRLGSGGEGGGGGCARLQGASLSLTSMHAQFGHTEEAMAALNETVRRGRGRGRVARPAPALLNCQGHGRPACLACLPTRAPSVHPPLQVRIAQQSSDDACLAHALASLCQILDATTPGTITSVGGARGPPPAARHHAQLARLLQRCLRRAEELQLPHLVAYALLALARFELLHGAVPTHSGGDGGGGGSKAEGGAAAPPTRPAAVAVGRALRDAAHLHLAAALAAALPAALPMATGLAAARVLRGAPELFGGAGADVFGPNTAGQQAACTAEVEQLAGSAHLLRAACWEQCGSRALAQAHALIYLDAYGSLGRTQDQCTALAALATSVAASDGPTAAEEVLAVADAAFPHAESRALAMARLCIAHDRALARRQLAHALALAQQMTGLACPTDATDIGLRLEAEERQARTLLAQGDAEGAVRAAHALFAVAAETGQPAHAARLLLLLGQAHAAAGAPLAALPYALSAAAHCRGLGLDLLGGEASLLMAQLWLDMGGEEGAARARAELEAVLPLAMAHGGLALRGAAQLALAEAVLEGAGAPGAAGGSAAADAEWALELLEGAGAAYRASEDWQQLARAEYVRALALDALGREVERDAAAAEHCRLLAQQSVE